MARKVFGRSLDVRSLITHRFPLERTADAVGLASRPTEDSLKVLVGVEAGGPHPEPPGRHVAPGAGTVDSFMQPTHQHRRSPRSGMCTGWFTRSAPSATTSTTVATSTCWRRRAGSSCATPAIPWWRLGRGLHLPGGGGAAAVPSPGAVRRSAAHRAHLDRTARCATGSAAPRPAGDEWRAAFEGDTRHVCTSLQDKPRRMPPTSWRPWVPGGCRPEPAESAADRGR